MHVSPAFLLIAVILISTCNAEIKISLNGQWKAKNSNNSINIVGNVPGSIYTDLVKNGILGDPYYRFNDIEYRWVAYDNWTYSRTFQITEDVLELNSVKLDCGGIDTIATISINGIDVGSSKNMFIRYVYDIKHALKGGENIITVAFTSAVKYAASQAGAYPYVVPPVCPAEPQNGECHVNFIKKEKSTDCWDWGPAFPTQGIWRNITIEAHNTAKIQYITPLMFPDKDYRNWRLQVNMWFDVANSSSIIKGKLMIQLPGLNITYSDVITLQPIANFYTTNITVQKPELWWPNTYGGQPLYDMRVSFSSGGETSMRKVKIGFRKVELIQQPILNTNGLTFCFQINGVAVYMKGSNWIPADSFQERLTPKYIRNLLQSAADANMNMLRIWGGGIYEQEDVYAAADELGIMIWQDIMFACAMYPTNSDFLANVDEEVHHQIRRLMRHPSIALWAGNNENEAALIENWYKTAPQYKLYYNDYVKLYIDVIKTRVESLDPTRPFVSSSPSNGVETEKEGWVAKNPQDPLYGDVHHYDYTGNSWDYTIYPVTRFTSEYGIQSWCSFETLEKVSIAEDWDFGSKFVNHRQHHGSGNQELMDEVQMNLNPPNSSDPVKRFKDWIYLTQINQAMGIKTESELLRRSQSTIVNGYGMTMGSLYWQLDDIWQAPTWASIEYGGKWKMLHYYATKFYGTALVSPYLNGNRVKVNYIYNGQHSPDQQQINVDCYTWNNSTRPKRWIANIYGSLQGSTKVFDMDLDDMLKEAGCPGKEHCFLYISLSEGRADNTLFLTNFKDAQGLQYPTIKIINVMASAPTQFTVTLQTSSIAPFVWLEANGVSGRFSDNGFLMIQSSVEVTFTARQDVDSTTLMKALTVRSLLDVYW